MPKLTDALLKQGLMPATEFKEELQAIQKRIKEASPEHEVKQLQNENLNLMDAAASLYVENQSLKNEDLNNKEAIANLYVMNM